MGIPVLILGESASGKSASLRNFQPVTAIVREPDKYELLLAQAKSEMAAYLNKYNTLKELQPFRDAFAAMA